MNKRIAALVLACALFFGACTTPGNNPGVSDTETITIFTWATYFPDDILAEFTHQTGIKVNYVNFDSNEEMLMKLEASKGGDYDIVLASDYIIDIAAKQGLVGELDRSLIPNYSNIDPAFQSKFFDPDNKFAVPYAAGIPAIIYNPDLVDFEITGYEDLWNPKLVDSIVVPDDARNVIGITLKTLGESFNTTDPAVLAAAKEKLLQLKPNIRALDYSTPYNLMTSGETAVGYMFTSQVLTALESAPDLKVVYPKEGLGFGIDACFVPVNAPNRENAHKLLDFILDGERSARISEQVYYINCNTAAYEFIKNDALKAPSDLIAQGEFIMDVGEATEIYNDIWTDFKMS